jgi:hypothetical protein
MRRILILLSLLFPVGVMAQTAVLPVYSCVQNGVQAVTSGLPSSNYLQGIIPYCTVNVYLTGTTTIATTTPQSPLTANTNGSIPPIYAAVNQGYDVVLSGGIPPNVYSTPVPITDIYPSQQFINPGGNFGYTIINSLTGWESLLNNAASNSSFYFMPGNYSICTPVNIGANGSNNIIIDGAGPAQVTITAICPMAYMFRTDGVNATNVQIGGFSLQGNGEVSNADLWVVNDTWAYNTLHDMFIQGGSNAAAIIQTCQACKMTNVYVGSQNSGNLSPGKGIVFLGDNSMTVDSLISGYNTGNGIEVHACEAIDWATTRVNCIPVMELAANVTSTSQTTFSVVDGQYAAAGQVYRIGQYTGSGPEQVLVTGVTETPVSGGQPTWSITVTRGYNGTTPATYNSTWPAAAGIQMEALNPTTFASLTFTGGMTFTGTTTPQDNGGHAFWINSLSPTVVDNIYIERVPDLFDGLRISGVDVTVTGGTISGTASNPNVNSSIHILAGGEGTNITGINVVNVYDNFSTALIDPSVTSYHVQYPTSYLGVNTQDYYGPGMSSNPSMSWGGCGPYNSGGILFFTCPLALATPPYPIVSQYGLTQDGTYNTSGITFGNGVPPYRSTVVASPTGAIRATGVTTITTTAAHGFVQNDYVYQTGITAVGGTNFNGSYGPITVTGTTTYTYPDSQTNDTGGGGFAIESSRINLQGGPDVLWTCNTGQCAGPVASYWGYGSGIVFAPSQSDLTTGIALPAAGQMDLYASGTKVAHLDSTGFTVGTQGIGSSGPISATMLLPAIIYSHAGTQLSACSSTTLLAIAGVSDATSLTPGTAYSPSAGAGSDATHVQCTLTGSTYAWQTM